MMDDFDLTQLVEPLQRWFTENARVLPWRDEPKPYYVWVSEIMLQQTRVEAVKPYFDRFIGALPDIEALAACPEDQYLKLWEGLGYYNRVRNLNIAAKQVVEAFGGELPADYDQLLTLKGIGHYTAGAIASIAFHLPRAAVDGNVLRVITRVTADTSDIMKQSVKNQIETRLNQLMQEQQEKRIASGEADSLKWLQPHIFNQALMELGALICVPNGAPHCQSCPWETFCRAKKEDKIAFIPVKKKAKARKIEERTVFVIRDGEKVALRKRPQKGLLAGMYELPNQLGKLSAEEVLEQVKGMGFSPIRVKELESAKHIFSHVEWHMTGYLVTVEEMEFSDEKSNSNKGKKEDERNQKNKKKEELEELEELKEKERFIFVEAEDAKERYAIPSAFAKYASLLSIPIGKDGI